MPSKYPVPRFVYLQCILTHDSLYKSRFRKAEPVLVKNEHVKYM